jgi:hypothetical protein
MGQRRRNALAPAPALAERQLEELRALRVELERQTTLLARMLEKLASLERSQYS